MPLLPAILLAVALATSPPGEEQTSVPPLAQAGQVVQLADVHQFGALDRTATCTAWLRAKQVRDQLQQLLESDDAGVRRIDYWHTDVARFYAICDEARRICAIYDEIDNLALFSPVARSLQSRASRTLDSGEIELLAIDSERTLKALNALYLLLGPDDYYRGRVPPIPPEVFP